MSSFVFIVATSDYNTHISYICPIINTDSTFTDLSSNIVTNGNSTTTITWTWSLFTDIPGSNDGLKISNNSNFRLNVASLNITAYGSVPLSRNSTYGFQSFSGRITATDAPTILSNTNFTGLFRYSGISPANFGNLNLWDVSNVTNMSSMFQNCAYFNNNISSWNVSNVTNMSNMFNGSSYFNQDINNWNTINVTNMQSMFFYCYRFNKPLNNWIVSSVTNMNYMFGYCNIFNQNLSYWNTINVTDMGNMFYSSGTFNSPLISSDGQWNTSNVTNMQSMFSGCTNFNQSLNNWSVSAVTNMQSMFYGCSNFNQPLNTWNVSAVTNMSNMFQGCTVFNQPLNNWTTSSLIYGYEMFVGCSMFDGSLNSWDVSRITNMQSMFSGCTNFNQSLNTWDVSNVTSMQSMFRDCTNFNQSLNTWDVSAVTNMSSTFNGANSFNQPLNNWNVSAVTSMQSMFGYCNNFNQNLSSWNTINVTDMGYMFYSSDEFNSPLISSVGQWNTLNVTNMEHMFQDCNNFNQSLNTWNVSTVSNMSNMFQGCSMFDSSINTWNVSTVSNMSNMFQGCSSFNQDISGWNVSVVTNMNQMFKGCSSYNYPAIGSWNFTNNSNLIDFIQSTGFSSSQYGQFLVDLSNNTTLQNNINLGHGYIRYNTTDVSTAFTYLTTPVLSGGKNMSITDALIDNSITISSALIFTTSTSNYNTYSANICPIINTDGTFTDLSSNVLDNGNGNTTIAWTWSLFTDISGSNDGCRFYNNPNFKLPLNINIYSYGSVPLSRNSVNGFRGFSGVITAHDSPTILSNTNFASLFAYASCSSSINFGNLNNWLVSTVTNMSSMFNEASYFNQPLNNWLVSAVTNMSSMFTRANSFNQPLNNWLVSSVTNMAYMFSNTNNFNQPLNNWNVSAVTNMSEMFKQSQFKQPLNNWNVSAVTNMSEMFQCSYNQPLNNWNVSSVTNMYQMFYANPYFDQDISGWNVSSVTNMSKMFYNTTFNYPLNNWNVSAVTNMSEMFGYGRFNQPLNSWTVSAVTNMNSMFANNTRFNQDIGNWTITNGNSMYQMFYGCTNFNQVSISLWNFTNVPTIQNIIALTGFNIAQYNQFLINLSNNITLPNNLNFGNGLIRYNNALTNNAYTYLTNSVIDGGKNMGIVDSIVPTPLQIVVSTSTYNSNSTYIYPIINTDSAFTNLSHTVIDNGDGTTTFDWLWDLFTDNGTTNDGLKITNNSNFRLNDASLNITIFGSVKLSRDSSGGFSNFTGQISATDVPTILSNTNFTNLFANTHIPTNKFGNISNWNVSTVTNMHKMFINCTNFNQDINSWNVSAVTNMNSMFYNCPVFDQDISGWTVSSVTNMGDMFYGCTNFNQPINNWTVASVTNMNGMFTNATNFNQPLNNWSVASVTNMGDMFYGCTNFNQPINNWAVASVTNMGDMFYGCTIFNQPINNWSVSNVTNMSSMFANATSFNQSIGSWNFTNVSNITDMIKSTAYNFAQYSNFLVDLSNNSTLPNNLNLGTTNLSRNGDIITSRAFTQLTNPVISGGKNMQILDSIACFLEGTLIQCLDKNTKQDIYKPIQDLRQGDLIKTYKHGYVPLNMIGCSKIFNPGNNDRITNRLYKCSVKQYPSLFEDLIITGCHSILVNDFKTDERENTRTVLKKIYITDDKYRLPACVDNNAEPYENQGIFTIYHIALDNPDYYMNYGVYANGLLVETCSRRYLTELANMQIITDSYNLQ